MKKFNICTLLLVVILNLIFISSCGYQPIKTYESGHIEDYGSTAGPHHLHVKSDTNIFDIDEGARYVGEFSLGFNPMITKPMGDILYDEKIMGSLHFTPGRCYEDCDNGNVSSIHWDLVLIQTEEYGGGEIYFDDILIRKDGNFVLHGDFHPENVIVDNKSNLFLIDMMNVCKGPMIYDIARTYFLLGYNPIFQERYLSLMGYSMEEIKPYLEVISLVRENEMIN